MERIKLSDIVAEEQRKTGSEIRRRIKEKETIELERQSRVFLSGIASLDKLQKKGLYPEYFILPWPERGEYLCGIETEGVGLFFSDIDSEFVIFTKSELKKKLLSLEDIEIKEIASIEEISQKYPAISKIKTSNNIIQKALILSNKIPVVTWQFTNTEKTILACIFTATVCLSWRIFYHIWGNEGIAYVISFALPLTLLMGLLSLLFTTLGMIVLDHLKKNLAQKQEEKIKAIYLSIYNQYTQREESHDQTR